MAPKKKKKAASNPARGFATTSVASKPKLERQVEAPLEVSENEKPVDLPQPSVHNEESVLHPNKAIEQTPEELEAQLENDELQLLVEKYASKTRRESRRQVSRIQIDQRVLRPQAHFMTVHDWLPNEILDEIIALAKAESNDSNRRLGQQSLLKLMSEEEAMSKLWALGLILKDRGFSEEHIQPVLRWLCANATNVDPSASVWGLQESLEWLVLNEEDVHSLSYEESETKPVALQSRDTSRPATPAFSQSKLTESFESGGAASPTSRVRSLHAQTPQPATPVESDSSDAAVSDLDSDMEPDQLIPAYLKIKGRLFQMDPDSLSVKPVKSKAKARSGKTNSTNGRSAAVRKLHSQLQQIESDALFDRDQAEAEWPMKRNQIAQENASKRNFQSPEPVNVPNEPQQAEPGPTEFTTSEKHTVPVEEDLSESSLLGDMFSAIPDSTSTAQAQEATTSPNDITLRDFGKQSGLSPRRILEETVRARDPNAKIAYKQISLTVYSCRHSLMITWAKDQDLLYEKVLPGVTCDVYRPHILYTAMTVATVSVEQSEAYISTVALFSMFSSSSKEEKAYLRLPTVWRELYKELLEHQQTRADSADRLTIKNLRSIIQDQVDQEEADGVVLTSRFKQRSQGAGTGSNTPDSSRKILSSGLDSLRYLWAQKSSTASFQRMLQARTTLPVFEYQTHVLSTIDKNQVTIICGETGCGKSTQIPSYILENELSRGMPCKIFCTEPRRISAISLAQRVSEELGEGTQDLGTNRSLVGYAIRLESKTSAQTRLVYATVGVVLRMLESSQRLDEVTHLIIDEVHERSIDSDFLLIILRSLMVVRPDLKVILMSATVDAQKFSDYLDNAPVMNIPGRTYPVQTKYLEDAIELTHYSRSTNEKLNETDTSEDEEVGGRQEKSGIPSKLPGYSSATRNVLLNYDEYGIDYDLILRLIDSVGSDPQLSRYSNAFLVFLPGIAEIRQLNDMLAAHPSFDRSWLIYPLHSTISSDDQQAAFHIPPLGMRKIVLATNIAETGVTIPDITCVIDTGKHKEMRFDERRQLSRLAQSFISRANAKQRRGRAGRVQEGLCFHLFTKYRHDNLMMDQQTPEMLRLSLQDLVMRTKICKLGDIEKTLSEALNPPTSKNIRRAIDALIEVDALTSNEELTPLGRQLAKLPLDAHLGKLVLLSTVFGVVDVAITIAALLSSKSPFLTPFGARQRAHIARLAFKKGDSDLLTAYNAYKAWKAVCLTPGRSEIQFCHKNFLSSQNLGNIEDLKAQLLSSLVDAGFVQVTQEERKGLSRYRTYRNRNFITVPAQYDTDSENETLVNSIIAAAFYPKILIKDGKGWRNIANNQTVSLAPTSVNKGTKTATFLSYYHIMQSSSKFYNAHSTSIAHPLPMTLMVGADVDFKLHAGVISLPGNVLRFSVSDWRVCTALKVLRRRIKEIVNASWKSPGRTLSSREREWMGLFVRIFVEREEKMEKIREGAAGKGK